jgi:serine/threonine-protein kinase TTK/MPS1
MLLPFGSLSQLINHRSDHDTMKGYMNEIQLLKRLDGNPNIIQLVEHDLRNAPQRQEGTLLMVICV